MTDSFLIDFPLVPPLGFVVPSLFQCSIFFNAFNAQTDVHLNSLDNGEQFDWEGQKPSDLIKGSRSTSRSIQTAHAKNGQPS